MTLREAMANAAEGTSDAEIAAAYNAPRYERRRDHRVTAATVASMLGRVRAMQLLATLAGAADGGAANAMLALSVLNGSGFDPSDPEAQAAVGEFVEGGVIAAAEATRLLYFADYNAGAPDVTAEDVAAERVNVAREQLRGWAEGEMDRRRLAVARAIDVGETDRDVLRGLMAGGGGET